MLKALEIYRAAQGKKITEAAVPPFTIEVRFLEGLTETQRAAFRGAADRWTAAIVGDLPAVEVEGEEVDDVMIVAQGVPIDGRGGILGQAGPTHLRPAGAGRAAFLPARGIMSFDTADLAAMEQEGTLNDVITHEMGHVLGIGTLWTRKGFLEGSGTSNPVFTGSLAAREYGVLTSRGPTPVPVENTGGPGTREGHWRESVFGIELMSGFIAAPGNPISTVTVGSLEDLGYEIDLAGAEPFQLEDLLALAERGPRKIVDLDMILPVIPMVLPEDSLR